MKKYQLLIYKIVTAFSAIINVFLIILLCYFIIESVIGNGDFFFEGKSLLYFSLIIIAFTIFNIIFVLEFKKSQKRNEK